MSLNVFGLRPYRAFFCGRTFWHSAVHYVADIAPLGQEHP